MGKKRKKSYEEKFYEGVNFKNKRSKKYLRKSILYWAKKSDGHIFEQFHNMTNYMSHTNVKSNIKFRVCYPITISGMSLLDICIEDANKNVFHIALKSDRIIYFEREEGTIEISVAKFPYKSGEGQNFYSKKISYTVEE